MVLKNYDENALLLHALIFEKGHPRRTQHILKVYALARLLGEQEGLDGPGRAILNAASILHDLAIGPCKKKYGNACQENQRKEAPALVEHFLIKAGYPPEWFHRIIRLVLMHHCYGEIDCRELQLLIEADLIVNCYEAGEDPSLRTDGSPKEAIAKAARQAEPVFKTATGKLLLRQCAREN